MIDITYENFESDLIAASTQVPVLLDIWAEWCGPCKALGPVLEQLEAEYAGRFILAKVNADQYPEIAQQLSQMFGVRSIPFCVLFKGGQPIDGFVGALPADKIRGFLDQHVAGEGELASEAETVDAEQALAEGDPNTAFALLQDALAKDPGNDEARYDLIKLLLAEGALEEAQAIYAPIASRGSGPVPEQRVVAFGRYIEALATARAGRSPAELAEAIAANKRDFAARYALAQLFFAAGEFTQAMDELLEIIMRDKTWNDELARKTYIAILEVMGKPAPKPTAGKPAPGAAAADGKPKLEIAGKMETAPADPVIEQYRRKLSMALF
ncbi:tetratricopeptide repeat protein [Aquabacterium fontiphilum]|jgi:putative thioredoxin|uniref:tetratricopeptide repeat protein n=1 Tax=Aquabacterium fontiphilum TaxID=450365 RepID=UPI0013780E64|nr:tetratricopeptide repeat protein [Aquabacterium fontiphilum]NBD21115.1 tetratricopeptide repeat protein [Aquabacterium fontiphilum]